MRAVSPLAGIAGDDEAGNMGDVAKAASRQFARVERADDLRGQRGEVGAGASSRGRSAPQSRSVALSTSKP